MLYNSIRSSLNIVEPLINSIGPVNRKVATDLKSNNNKSLRIILHPLIFHFGNISEKWELQMRSKEVKEFLQSHMDTK